MATNPIPKGTCQLSVNVPVAFHARLKALAARSGMKLSAYCRRILEDATAPEVEVIYETVRNQGLPISEIGSGSGTMEDPDDKRAPLISDRALSEHEAAGQAGLLAGALMPAGESPAGESPAGESPAGESPAGESPAGESPADPRESPGLVAPKKHRP